ncbi:MAG TPA: methionyl-tRNA formyltransferase [Fibrobacteria bacterium]|mgnify:CR=1 FL=1|nr:methionyl-tRNA formyltransferase [Fibrobacteria bacterium]
MRVVFLGTPPVAATCLEGFAKSRHEIAMVGTHPDRIAGRGLKPVPTAVKEMAARLGLPVLEVPDVKDPAFAQALRDLQADLLVVVAFVVLPPEVLGATRLGAINLHGSLLPKWRGAAPVQRAVESGEAVTGGTIFRLDNGVDTGGIILQEKIEIGPDDTSGDVLAKLAEQGGAWLARAVDHLEANPADPGLKQDPALATRAPKLFPEEGSLDFTKSAQALHDKIRAFHPAPGCWCRPSGRLLKIWRTRVMTESVGAAGEASRLPDGRVAVACGAGSLELVEVQPEGKKRQSGGDWFNGLRADLVVLS